jgi:putative restriction endonuclease
MNRALPLVWFFGVGPGLYLPTFPVFIVGEEPHQHQSLVDAVSGGTLEVEGALEETLKTGITAVRNGLALCKIHHAALDSRILGVRPDYVVEIRADLLEETYGPMLRYGLQERHRQKLMVLPTSRRERPDPELLEVAYESFRAAG